MTAGGAEAASERNINTCRTASRLVFTVLHQAGPAAAAAATPAQVPGRDVMVKTKGREMKEGMKRKRGKKIHKSFLPHFLFLGKCLRCICSGREKKTHSVQQQAGCVVREWHRPEATSRSRYQSARRTQRHPAATALSLIETPGDEAPTSAEDRAWWGRGQSRGRWGR